MWFSGGYLNVLPFGQILIRNVCMPWDAYYRKQKEQNEKQRYSRTI